MEKSAKSLSATCGDCEHSLVVTGLPLFDYRGQHFLCGFETPLDTNLPGEYVGLTNFRPDWCPVRRTLVQQQLAIGNETELEQCQN